MHVCAECGQGYDRPGRCAADGSLLAHTDDPLLGTELGRYRLARVLGEGGMGRVYLGLQPAIGGRVAIKVLTSESRELVERIFAEARAVNLIRHENIVDVIDLAHLPDGRPYIVMELVDGQTLRELIRARSATLDKIAVVMTEVLAALAAAHAIQIVHRDLKPDNVIVTAGGHAKVLDFGIAKLVAGRHGDVPHTMTGQALGTPEYMAPEQVSGGPLDARTDLYAAGVVLFELVTGRRPFEAKTDFELMRAHLEDAPPSARVLRPDLPPAIDDVIQRALEKDPARRFQTASAMASALATAVGRPPPRNLPVEGDRLAATGSQPTVAERPGARPKRAAPPSRIRRRWSIAGIAAAMAAGALATIAIARHGDPAPPALSAPPSIADAPATPVPTMLLGHDPSHFDLIAYLPQAQALARTELADAELVWFSARSVDPWGLADLTQGPTAYMFRSPSSHDPSRSCEVTVALKTTAAYVLASKPGGACDAPIGARPRCTITDARRKVAVERQRGAITWTIGKAGGRWSFGTGDDALKVDDDCGGDAEPPAITPPTTPPLERRVSSHRDAGAIPLEAGVDARVDAPAPPDAGGSMNELSTRLVLAADYDERRLDIDAYRSTALAHARRLDPEARTLIRLWCEQVFVDGHADLRNGRCELRFASPAKSAWRTTENWCNTVIVDLTRADVNVSLGMHECTEPLPHAPRCGVDGVWKLARAAGADPTKVAEMTYEGRWRVVVGVGSDNVFVKDFPDACP